MPRIARKQSKTGIYHVIMRGINRSIIFKDDEDYVRFIKTLQKYREICGFELYAYCLMGNHVHLLLKEGSEPLATIMRRICGSFVLWYNAKYNRIGNLFQGRFKSEPVENDSYFLTVLRYIFQNPVKANIVPHVQDYNWTNYHDYIKNSDKTDIEFVLNMFYLKRKRAINNFIEFVKQKNGDICEDIEDERKIPDDKARNMIIKKYGISNSTDLQNLEINKRNSCLKELKAEYGLSIRQIERLTGINRGIIQRL